MSRAVPSLSSALLARKGGAQPAMRRPVYSSGPVSNPLEDLGWNDMGLDYASAEAPAAPVIVTPATEAPVTAVVPAVVVERSLLAERIARQSGSRTGKAAFTLRLDSDRHLKLRLACAVSGRSAQQIVTEALDSFLGAVPEVAMLADKLSCGGGKN